MPAPQSPASQPPKDSALDFDPPLWAENVEYCVVRCFSPQEGQVRESASALRRTSFSNLVPQSSHAYSKIGMLLNYKIPSTCISPFPQTVCRPTPVQ